MKKILIPILLGMLCSPVIAEPTLHDFVRELGYTDAFIDEACPEIKNFKSDVVPSKAKLAPQKNSYSQPRQALMAPADLLHPRVFQKGEAPDMIPFLSKLHKQNPASDKITRKLAVTCLRSGQPREALYWYIQTYQRDRSDFESLWNMASIAYRLGEMDQAEKYLKEYAALDPNSAWGRMARDFLAGGLYDHDMTRGFKSGFGRTMTSSGSQENDTTRILREQAIASGEFDDRATGGLMVIEGKRTNFESFMNKMENSESPKPNKKSAALEGKSRVRSSSINEGSSSSLQRAKIVEKTTDKPVSAMAEMPDPTVNVPEKAVDNATAPQVVP